MDKVIDIEEQIKSLIDFSGIQVSGNDVCANSLEKVKTPLNERIERSKFTKLIEDMTNEDLKLTAYAICFNRNIQDAVKCYHTSVNNYVQIASLIKQLNDRGIIIEINDKETRYG